MHCSWSKVSKCEVPAGPVTGVLDTFDSTNNSGFGSNWDGTPPGFQILKNKLDVVLSGKISWLPAVFGADQEPYVAFETVDRYDDTNGQCRMMGGRFCEMPFTKY